MNNTDNNMNSVQNSVEPKTVFQSAEPTLVPLPVVENAQQSVNPTISGTIPQSVNPTVSGTIPQSVNPTVPGTIPQGVNSTIPGAISQNVNPTVPETIPQSVNPTVPETIPQNVNPTVPGTIPQSVNSTIPGTIPQSVNPTVPETIPQNVNSTIPVTIPQNVNPTVVPNQSLPNNDSVVISDQLEKVEIEYKPLSKFKVVALVLLFVLLIGFIIFLPDITTLIEKYKSGEDFKVEKITTGKLKCLYETTTSSLDKSYHMTFSFRDSQLKNMEFIIVTRGDASADEEELNTLEANCRQLLQDTEGSKGFFVRCSSINGTLTETQSFDLGTLDSEKLSAAFYEAGGTYPEFTYNQNIDMIEKNMNASGYNCNRE